MYFVIAVFTPQSRNRVKVADGINAIAYNPYCSGEISLATTMVPIANIMLESAIPMNNWKLPVAEDLPILSAFSENFPSAC